MKGLAKLGFTQSYTYFTWRTQKWEIEHYLNELTGYPERDYYRPNFFVNTPDILPYHLQSGEPWMFKSRVALAATLSSTYGIYNGFELLSTSRSRGAKNISTPRSTRSRFATGTSLAISNPISRVSIRRGAPIRRFCKPAICGFSLSTTASHRLHQEIRRSGTTRSRSRSRFRARAMNSGCRLATPDRRRQATPPVAAIENLMTGERHPHRVGRSTLADRSITGSRALVSLPGVRSVMNVMSSIDTKEADGDREPTISGTRTRSSINFTSRHSPTATMTASATSPA